MSFSYVTVRVLNPVSLCVYLYLSMCEYVILSPSLFPCVCLCTSVALFFSPRRSFSLCVSYCLSHSLIFTTIETQTFKAGEVCPKDHVKLSGVSICEAARDLCKPCSPLIPKAQVECRYGVVAESKDDIGCPINV